MGDTQGCNDRTGGGRPRRASELVEMGPACEFPVIIGKAQAYTAGMPGAASQGKPI